jgi:hypothetical protein
MPPKVPRVSSKPSADKAVSVNDESKPKCATRATFKLRQEDRQPATQQRKTKPPTQRKKQAPLQKSASADSAGVGEAMTILDSQRVPAQVDVEKDNNSENFELDDRNDDVAIMVCFSLHNHCLYMI